MRWWTILLVALAAAAGGGCERTADRQSLSAREEARPALGLMTSLPIYWGEPAQMSDLLAGSAERHWVRDLLEQDHTLLPLDSLGVPDGQPTAELAGLDRLLVAQPRALTAADNVALDSWVRGGGRLLLVLDPMMTEHSAYAVGDKRRFNDVALIPPLLERWGLALRHAEAAPPRQVRFRDAALAVDEYGVLSLLPSAGSGADCAIEAEGLAASCRLGSGRALILADAAFLNDHAGGQAGLHAADTVFDAAFD